MSSVRRMMMAASGGGFSNQAVALFSRFSTPPTYTRAKLIDSTIRALMTAGVWQKMDSIYVMAAHDSQAARLNWITGQYDLAAVSGPTFTNDRGYQGDGVAAYLDTGFNPNSAPSPKFTQDNSHAGIWSLTDIAIGAADSFDAFSTTTRITRSIAAAGRANCRPSSGTTANIGDGAYPGHAMWTRSASNLWVGYANGVQTGGGAGSSTAITNATFRLLSSSATGFGYNQIGVAHFGSDLTPTETSLLYSALQSYLQAVGAI